MATYRSRLMEKIASALGTLNKNAWGKEIYDNFSSNKATPDKPYNDIFDDFRNMMSDDFIAKYGEWYASSYPIKDFWRKNQDSIGVYLKSEKFIREIDKSFESLEK